MRKACTTNPANMTPDLAEDGSKGKAEVTLRSRHEHVWKSGGIDSLFLTSVLDGEWSDSRPGRFNPGETAPATHWIGGCVGLRAGLEAEK
jgi:hypothetical protein